MSSAAEMLSPAELERRERARSESAGRLAESLDATRRQRFAPPPKLSVSQWADQFRQLSPESSAEPGQWSTDRVPWARAIMDAASEPETDEIVACQASQTVKTEVLNNIVGYHVHLAPCPMLAVFPTDRMATTWSKDRLGPMLRDSDSLRGLVLDRKDARIGSGSSEILEKKFPGGLLAITGANSASGLAMRPVRIILGDETDRWPASAGGKGGYEGDPMSLAAKRTSNFDDSLHFWSSSPGATGRSIIWAKYLLTDRNRWWTPCPHCGVEQVLRWEQVVWSHGLTKEEKEALTLEELAARARYQCEHCEELWEDSDRWEAAAAGRWIPDAPKVRRRRGFWINCLVSPWLTLAKLVAEFLEAQNDNEALQVFVNTRLAETWDDAEDRVEPDELLERLEPYDQVPQGVLLVTAGVDVQKNSVEVTRYGWGLGGEAWALDHHVLLGSVRDLLRPEESDDHRLDDLLIGDPLAREDGAVMRVAASCIDTGSDAGEFYEDVLQYCRKRRARKVFAVKGRAGEQVPVWPLRATKVKGRKRRGELYIVGVDACKSTLRAMLKREKPEDWKAGEPVPGYLHFPRRPEFDAEFFAQLAAEVPRPYRRRGRIYREWIQEYIRAEASDCFNYARAALAALNPNWARLLQTRKRSAQRHRPEPEDEPEADELVDDEPDDRPPQRRKSEPPKKDPPSPRRPSRRRKRRGGFATNW